MANNKEKAVSSIDRPIPSEVAGDEPELAIIIVGGGSSSVNEWSISDVLPAFQASERTVSRSDQCHGRSGPEPIHQLQDAGISDMQQGFIATAELAGFARVKDFNSLTERVSQWLKG